MNYIGSKLSLLDFIENSMHQIVDQQQGLIFCDLFAGTGAVGTHFKNLGYKVIANDIQYYSFVLNRHYIGNHTTLKFDKLTEKIKELKYIKLSDRKNYVCQYLQNLDGLDGFVTNNYSPAGKEGRMYFTVENAKKCDAIREQIEQWYAKNNLTEDEYYYLLATLLESIDKSANTASVYGAFLKNFKKSAQKNLIMKPLPLHKNDKDHEVYNRDVKDLIKLVKSDILYLDPPYNTRQYSANYHVLETIAKNDKPSIKGKTGLRDWSDQKSDYSSKAKVKQAFSELISNAKADYIFLSYNNEGLLSFEDIKSIMSTRGEYGFFTKGYGRFKADNGRKYSADKTTEYLHYVVCK